MGDVRERIVIDGDADGAVSAVRRVTGSFDDLDKSADRAGKGAKRLGVAGVAAGVGIEDAARSAIRFGFESVKAFRDAERQMASAELTLDKNVKGWRKNRAEVDKTLASHEKIGKFDGEDLFQSFSRLAASTKNTTKALELQRLAMDISREKGISLEKATTLVARANDGQASGLKRLVGGLKDGASSADILAAAQQRFAGQAAKFGSSQAGQAEEIRNAWGNIQEDFGQKLIPIVKAVMNAFVTNMPTIQAAVVGVWNAVSPIFEALLKVAKDVVEVFKANWPEISRVLNFVGGVIQVALTVITAVISALLPVVVAVVAGVINAIVGIAAGISAAVGGIRTAATAVWGAIKTALTAPLRFATWLSQEVAAPIVGFFTTAVTKGRELAGKIVDGIKGFVWNVVGILDDKIVGPIRSMLDTFLEWGSRIGSRIAGGIKDGATNAWETVRDGFKSILNRIIDVINKLPFVNIPKLADGAVIAGPTLALVGEAGPELVLPLAKSKRRRSAELLSTAAAYLGIPGDVPGPQTRGQAEAVARRMGVPTLAEGAFVLPRQADGTALAAFYASALLSRNSQTWGDSAKSFIAKGLANAVGLLPDVPAMNPSLLSDGLNYAKTKTVDFLRDVFSRPEVVNVGGLLDAHAYAADVVGRGRYTWGGGHGAWDFSNALLDCSGFTSHAAKKAGAALSSPGTTMSLWPLVRGHGGPDNPFAFGFRGMGSSDPRAQHMGAKILGEWFQFGPRRGGADSQWDVFGVPPGLPGYRAGIDYVPSTGPAMLHVGEAVLNRQDAGAFRRGGNVTIYLDPAMEFLRDFIRVEVDGRSRSARLLSLAGGRT